MALLLTPGVVVSSAFAAGAANMGACPNEQLRVENQSTQLPDCRAYERVSPAFTYGQLIGAEHISISPDGSRVGYEGQGDFGEPKNGENVDGPIYIAARGNAGWSSEPLSPPAAEFQSEHPSSNSDWRGVNYDLTSALYTLAPAAALPVDFRYYRRDAGPSGALTEIGPLFAPTGLASWAPQEQRQPAPVWAGATRDLSHILFSPLDTEGGPRWYWPGDPTRGNISLYEYSGNASQEPVLVGIKPGPSERHNKPSESPTVISQCGTQLGGAIAGVSNDRTLDNYNAISSVPTTAEGRTVVFTALAATEGQTVGHECESSLVADELYARIGGERTVAISEPSHEDCELCDTSKAAQQLAPEGALFQGASADGSKVYFLSNQKLFDGTLGENEANLYEYDFESVNPHQRISLVAPSLAPGGGVVRVTQDGSRVYLVSRASLPGAVQNEYGVSPAVGEDNLYSDDTSRKQATFIAILSSEDSGDWAREDFRGAVQATPDGRFLLFGSINNLTHEGSEAASQLYKYDAAPTSEEGTAGARRLVRVSIGDPQSNNGNSAPFFVGPQQAYFGADRAARPTTAMSADGSKVFFETPAALTPGALDKACIYEVKGECFAEAFNVYEYEAGNVFLLSSGKDVRSNVHGTATTLLDVSPSGADVIMASDDALTGAADTETGQNQLYDIRVNGGFPAETAPVPCVTECQQGGTGPPTFGSAGSTSFNGIGNATPNTAHPARKTLAQLRAKKLATALKACRKRRDRRKRAQCERLARARYGARSHHAHSATRGGTR
jgi:hypothetical protein